LATAPAFGDAARTTAQRIKAEMRRFGPIITPV